MHFRKILIAHGGGATALISQSLALGGVVLKARRFRNVDLMYSARHDVHRIVNEDFVDLSLATSRNPELVVKTSSPALGSTRDKPDLQYFRKILDGHFSTSAAMPRRTPCGLSVWKPTGPTILYAVYTYPTTSTTTWPSMIMLQSSHPRHASWPKPLPAPIWITLHCLASTSASSWVATRAS